MWKNDRRSAVIRNIIYAVLAAVVLLYLAVAYKSISAKNAAIDAQLSEAHAQQQEEQVAEKQQNIAAVQNVLGSGKTNHMGMRTKSWTK